MGVPGAFAALAKSLRFPLGDEVRNNTFRIGALGEPRKVLQHSHHKTDGEIARIWQKASRADVGAPRENHELTGIALGGPYKPVSQN